MKLTAYGGNEIPNLGSCQVYVKGPDNPYPKSVQAEIVDVDDPAVNRQYVSTKFESSKAKLDSCCWEQQQTCHSGLETVPLTKEYLLKEYQLKMCLLVMCASQVLPYHVETNLNVSTVQYPPRQVTVQRAYQEELERLRRADIPEHEHNEYMPWVNSTVVTRKPNGTICLCLDPCDLNKAIQCNPTMWKP